MDIEKYYNAVKTAKDALYELENNFTDNNGHITVNEDSFAIAKKANEIINWNNIFQFSFRKIYKAESK